MSDVKATLDDWWAIVSRYQLSPGGERISEALKEWAASREQPMPSCTKRHICPDRCTSGHHFVNSGCRCSEFRDNIADKAIAYLGVLKNGGQGQVRAMNVLALAIEAYLLRIEGGE